MNINISEGPVAMSYALVKADDYGLALAYENNVGNNCNRVLKLGEQKALTLEYMCLIRNKTRSQEGIISLLYIISLLKVSLMEELYTTVSNPTQPANETEQ